MFGGQVRFADNGHRKQFELMALAAMSEGAPFFDGPSMHESYVRASVLHAETELMLLMAAAGH